MDLKIVDNKKQWNSFISGQPYAQFLQSWEWGEFQKSVHRRVWRAGFFDDDKQIGAAQIIEHYLGLGWAYLYCPRGPVGEFPIINFQFSIIEFLNFLKEKTSSYGEIFLRIEPSEKLQAASRQLQAIRVSSIQPAHVLLLDLFKSEEELLKETREKTRYNIRLAGRKPLRLAISNQQSAISQDDFGNFWKLLQETAKRDKIRLHPKNYYRLMSQKVPSYVLQVTSQNQWLAAGLFVGFGDTFSYVHGGSSNEHREMMAPYLLHWEAIKFAKNAGYHYYDFGGINPADVSDPNFRPKWAGITRFKTGFGGFIKSYAGAYDAPLNLFGYKLYRLLKKII